MKGLNVIYFPLPTPYQILFHDIAKIRILIAIINLYKGFSIIISNLELSPHLCIETAFNQSNQQIKSQFIFIQSA
jgi:hypothetical protein